MTAAIRPLKARYPIISLVAAVFLLSYFYLQTQTDLINFYHLPASAFMRPVPEALLGIFAVLVIIELRYVQRQRLRQQDLMLRVKEQFEELLANKKELNAKAHVYANHADKLKLFISDKLLEYIEYDEKFLHFKSIAGEVRHNGVISYDKISTVLEAQLAEPGESDNETRQRFRDARDSLRYLWDLLDLSTADNIALHIANQVCESEEMIFESELADEASRPPEQPVFHPRDALEKALTRCFGSAPVEIDSTRLQVMDHDWIWIQCQPADSLLGNENHVILALENLISNAQFFAGRRGSGRHQKRARIAIELNQKQGYVCYRIYNRGAHIDDETAGRLFQLGYSTRRVKEHHGKGLGLYFVNEITKGYDGNLGFTNIHNRGDVLSLRVKTEDGNVMTDVIELLVSDDTPLCRKSGSDSAVDRLEWQLASPVESIEITHQSDQKTHRRQEDALTNGTLFDPSQSANPRWRLDIDRRGKKSTTLKFRPLDIAGVQFELKLPSLTARLEGDLLSADEDDMKRQVDLISRQFKALEE